MNILYKRKGDSHFWDSHRSFSRPIAIGTAFMKHFSSPTLSRYCFTKIIAQYLPGTNIWHFLISICTVNSYHYSIFRIEFRSVRHDAAWVFDPCFRNCVVLMNDMIVGFRSYKSFQFPCLDVFETHGTPSVWQWLHLFDVSPFANEQRYFFGNISNKPVLWPLFQYYGLL